MILPIVLLAIFSLAMVGAMVQFNSAIVFNDPGRAENRALWGAIYVALWVGVELSLWDLIRRTHTLTASDIAALTLAPVGWFTFNAMWLALWGAIEARAAEQRRMPPAPGAIAWRRTGSRLTLAGLAAIVILLVPLGAPAAFLATITTVRPALVIVGALTVIGWTLLITGGVRLALGVGDVSSRNYGKLGKRQEASGEIETSFREVKDAWRRRLWLRDARWRSLFMMLFGAAFAAYGLFGIFIVVGPPVIGLLCAAALLYATARTAAGFWRA